MARTFDADQSEPGPPGASGVRRDAVCRVDLDTASTALRNSARIFGSRGRTGFVAGFRGGCVAAGTLWRRRTRRSADADTNGRDLCRNGPTASPLCRNEMNPPTCRYGCLAFRYSREDGTALMQGQPARANVAARGHEGHARWAKKQLHVEQQKRGIAMGKRAIPLSAASNRNWEMLRVRAFRMPFFGGSSAAASVSVPSQCNRTVKAAADRIWLAKSKRAGEIFENQDSGWQPEIVRRFTVRWV
jgi:hypothetical protein